MKPKHLIQRLKNLFWHLPKAIFYNFYYGFPGRRLTLIGITGTDGKTTTTNLLYHLLNNAGYHTAIISTLGSQIGDQNIPTGLHTTSPDPSVTQKLFHQMVEAGITHAIVEVTAHAIDQYRYYGCHFQISGITNTSHEHLDDFLSLEAYTQTKAKLLINSDFAILNADDQSFTKIKSQLFQPYISYSIDKKSNLQAKKIKIDSKWLTFDVDQTQFKTNSNYQYQTYNILLALAVSRKLGISDDIFQKTILNFPEIKGRREEINNDLKIRTIIDFAHTPAALEKTLSSLRPITQGKLICIFGATGGRDQTKRPMMGETVSQIADIAFITSDDTRNEKVEKINEQIIKGRDQKRLKLGKFKYFNISNRQDAFNEAVKISEPGDTIIACGKGHETTILLGSTEYPWSEAEAFRTAFRYRQNS